MYVDGRSYNLQVYNGVGSSTAVAQYVNFSVGSVALPDTGAFARIHQKDTMVAGLSVCHLGGATQQIGCLVNADPSSLGMAADAPSPLSWEAADPLSNGSCSNETSEVRVNSFADISCPAGTYPF